MNVSLDCNDTLKQVLMDDVDQAWVVLSTLLQVLALLTLRQKAGHGDFDI